MRKKIVSIILLFSVLILPLYSFSFYYGVGGSGERLNGKSHYAGVSVDAGISFFSEDYLALESEIVLSPLFESISINLSSSPFFTPVSFYSLFANPVLYSPLFRIGAEYVYQDGWYYRGELALLAFRDRAFAYEFLTPMITISASDFSLSYGIRLMRFSYYI